MSFSIDSDGLIDALAAFKKRETEGFESNVIVGITDIEGRTITEFEVSGTDLPAFSTTCQKMINNRLVEMRQILETELNKISAELGISSGRNNSITPKIREEINVVKEVVRHALQTTMLLTDEEALMVISVVGKIKDESGSGRSKTWMMDIVKANFICDERKNALILNPNITAVDDHAEAGDETETHLQRVARLLNVVHHDAEVLSDAELSEVANTVTLNFEGENTEAWIINVLKNCYRVDADTQKLISEGYVLDNGATVFAKAEDALAYLRKQGNDFGDFGEAHNAGEDGDIEPCWHEDFIETFR